MKNPATKKVKAVIMDVPSNIEEAAELLNLNAVRYATFEKKIRIYTTEGKVIEFHTETKKLVEVAANGKSQQLFRIDHRKGNPIKVSEFGGKTRRPYWLGSHTLQGIENLKKSGYGSVASQVINKAIRDVCEMKGVKYGEENEALQGDQEEG